MFDENQVTKVYSKVCVQSQVASAWDITPRFVLKEIKIIALLQHRLLLVCLYHVEVPDGKSVCPDRPRWKRSMSRPSQAESAYVQTLVR